MSKPENPLVFPFEETIRYHDKQDSHKYHEGMSLRDYFAGQFVAGYSRKWEKIHDSSFNEIAEQAYMVADAMLKEREK